MPVIGMNITSMKAEKGPQTKGEIKINSSPAITAVEEIHLHPMDKKALSIGFTFETRYEPDGGAIAMEGNLLFAARENESVLKQWKKDKSLPEDVNIQVLNHLFRKCLIRIAVMADELQLPPPLQLPLVKKKA